MGKIEKLCLRYDFDPRALAAVLATAPFFAASPLRDMQGIGIISTIPARASASVIHRNKFLENIAHFELFCEDRKDMPVLLIQPAFCGRMPPEDYK